MARTEYHTTHSAAYRQRKIIKGRLYVWVASGDKSTLTLRAKEIRSVGFSCRIVPSVYYGDWELWRSAVSNKTYRSYRSRER
jgi:hypothetical protein